MSDFGSALSSGAKIGADAYKVSKQIAPVAGDAWKSVDKASYDKYAVPGTATFLDVKDTGKSMGGWGAVDSMG